MPLLITMRGRILSVDKPAESIRGWVEQALKKVSRRRDEKWTERVAVGSEFLVIATKARLAFKAKGRAVTETDEAFELREPETSYISILGHENKDINLSTSYLKKRILVQDRDGSEFQPEGVPKEVPLGCILKYVEDLKRGANKDIGPKDFFEIACNIARRQP